MTKMELMLAIAMMPNDAEICLVEPYGDNSSGRVCPLGRIRYWDKSTEGDFINQIQLYSDEPRIAM